MTDTTIVIFGASGDLTERKLLPALFGNFRKGRLPEQTRIVGVSRSRLTDAEFREKLRTGIRSHASDVFDEDDWSRFSQRIHYRAGDVGTPESYVALESFIATIAPADDNRLYYLSIAPDLYPIAVRALGDAGMAREKADGGHRRIVVEKPFGRDLESAGALNRALHDVFDEAQVYRIDHYLGKETVQNIFVLRFGNAIFEPLWNRRYVDHVQITVAETDGVGHRAEFYERAGVLRDMFQNHLMQLLTLVAMEPPAVYEADALRNEKVKVLGAIRPMDREQVCRNTIRAQYSGYRGEPGVASDTETPTYGAVRLFIDNWRWQGVPFFLRSGKRMAARASEISVQFRRPPHQLFGSHCELFTNSLSMVIQPNEGMRLRFATKVPDGGMVMQPADMGFTYAESFKGTSIPEAYERLLLDALNGDASLFARSDEIEVAWRTIDPIVDAWASAEAPFMADYEPGSWGPAEANRLLGDVGRRWMVSSESSDATDPDA